MTLTLEADYDERVYAGVLGKIIAVYLGRPFEGWTYERIMAELGEITYYVNDRVDLPLKNHLLVVTDDDISGTLIFPRALRDLGPGGWQSVTSADVGRAWMNYIVENLTVLWWGGLGNSTEHTAYLRMADGVRPPDSGSIARNGRVVAEQVGAQIFCEAFAMTCPGDPVAAADLVEIAARVSHDGEAVNAARVVAALVAGAFAETDMDRALDAAMDLIPAESLIHRVIRDVRNWAAAGDWHATRAKIAATYGYDRYRGNCHVVPNHAVVIAALAHSQGVFSTAMTIVNTCGWDTDSNAGVVGSICGVFGGLPGLEDGTDWRGPVRDRIYLPSADGGAAISDAATEALAIAALGRDRNGAPAAAPRDGARFHFAFPGSVQGFDVAAGHGTVRNVVAGDASRALEIAWEKTGPVLAATPTFVPVEAREMPIYAMAACPAVYPGQLLTAQVSVPDPGSAAVLRLSIQTLDDHDQLVTISGPVSRVEPGCSDQLTWQVPDTAGQPVMSVGITADAADAVPVHSGTAVTHLESLTWSGEPVATFGQPAAGATIWRTGWVPAADRFDAKWGDPFRIVQNRGTGLLIHGSRDWRDYRVSADVTPHLADAVGLAARVQGLRRYVSIELVDRRFARLVRMVDEPTVLAQVPLEWEFGASYELWIEAAGSRLRAGIGDQQLFDWVEDPSGPDCGGIALTVTNGRSTTTQVSVRGTNGPHQLAPGIPSQHPIKESGT